MFVLTNAYGNVYKHVKTEHQRDRLLAQGYVDVTPKKEPPKKAKKTAAPKKADEE